MLSVNREAMEIVRCILDTPEQLGVKVSKLSNGATVIDMGQKVKGSWLAGKYYSLITLGGLAEITYEPFIFDSFQLNAVRVMTGHPLEACIGSQIAGWQLEAKKDAPILSGPARALNKYPTDHYHGWIDYKDHHHEGVISIQTSQPVDVRTSELIADACNIKPENLYIMVASNSSLVCAVQVCARVIEQTLHRLYEEGFDIKTLQLAQGYCVIPPLICDDLTAMGRINDAILYGGLATLYVVNEDSEIERVIHRIVSSASSAYGLPFLEIYKAAGCDFFKVPMDLNSPASVQIHNLSSGRSFSAVELNLDVLRCSFFEKQT